MPDYMNYPQPKLRLVKTVGNFFRVYVHGPDDLQDNERAAVMDIGRGPTREAAFKQAREWFASMEDDSGETASQ